jgi:hypothetical protein
VVLGAFGVVLGAFGAVLAASRYAGINFKSVISAGAKTRIGGPQNPVPRDTYRCASPRTCSPARYGCASATSHENGQI